LRKLRLIACALSLCLAGALAAQQSSPEEAENRAQDALKRAKVLRIVGVPGITRSLDSTLKALGARVAGQEVRIELAADALFDGDKAELRADASSRLEKVAVVLREFPAAPLVRAYPAVPVLIECHSDGSGSDADNQALSDLRAAAVKDWLVENAGIDPARLSTRGWGRSKPVVPSAGPDGKDNPEGRRKNGHVEITVKKG
jgi:outer membrane protein OmpA-like peptidoglycan-associated protein